MHGSWKDIQKVCNKSADLGCKGFTSLLICNKINCSSEDSPTRQKIFQELGSKTICRRPILLCASCSFVIRYTWACMSYELAIHSSPLSVSYRCEIQVITAVPLMIQVFCVVGSCRIVNCYRLFEGVYCLHLQGQRVEVHTLKYRLGLLDTEDGKNIILRNVGILLTDLWN